MKENCQILKMSAASIVVAICLLQSAEAYGQNESERGARTPPSFKELLKDMDANKDGKLSKREVKGPLKNDFDKIDANKDGFITKEEFESSNLRKRPGKKRVENRD
ncbi:MAG: hypothetical protein Crog4KO_06260 [Crocinitomicaceae bacterium]